MEVPGLDYPLILAADDAQADELVAEGHRRGTIWTLAEMAELLRAPGMNHEAAVLAARLRQEFNAMVVGIRPCPAGAGATVAASVPTGAPNPDPEQRRLDLGTSLRVEPD